jgi:hypothetical protein
MAEKTKKIVKATYMAYTRINIQVGVNIEAASLNEALELAQKLDIDDVVDMNGNEFLDGTDLVVEGVFLNQ